MTIASAFNDITVAKGGTPNKSGTIAGAIDALNDTLAGSDQPASVTIEGAIKRLGENIGGGCASFGPLKHIQCTKNGEPLEDMDGLVLSSGTTVAINTIIATVNSDYSGTFHVASGAYLGIIVDNPGGEDAYLTVDGGEPQHIDQVLSQIDEYYHVFQVPDAESIAVNITTGD